MTLSELTLWVHQLKNHLTRQIQLNQIQVEMIDLVYIILFVYVILLISKPTAARIKASAAVFICVAISYSPLYNAWNNVQYYSFLTLIYVVACLSITNKKVSATCCIMAVFEFLMVIDRYANAGIETWLYVHFEEITIVIHSLIISAFINWKLVWWRKGMGYLADCMRRLLRIKGIKTSL